MDQFVLNLSDLVKIKEKVGSWEKMSETYGTKATQMAMVLSQGYLVPDGFIITPIAYQKFIENGGEDIPKEVWDAIVGKISQLEQKTKKFFGKKKPLILNCTGPDPLPSVFGLGMNDFTAHEFATQTQKREIPFDIYHRLIMSLGIIGYGLSQELYVEVVDKVFEESSYTCFSDLSAMDLISLVKLFKAAFLKNSNAPFPQDSMIQLKNAVLGYFKLHDTKGMSIYRQVSQKMDKFSIIIQEAHFGSLNVDSACAIVSTHDLVSGDRVLSGRFAAESLLYDVIHECRPCGPMEFFPKAFPGPWNIVKESISKLEAVFKAPITVGYTIENKEVYIDSVYPSLFCENSQFKVAVESCKVGNISKEEAIMTIPTSVMRSLTNPKLIATPSEAVASSVSGSTGAAVGVIAFSNQECIEKSRNGDKVILIKNSFNGLDLEAIDAAAGLVSRDGGQYSFPAYLSRVFGKPSVIGLRELVIDQSRKKASIGKKTFLKGSMITLSQGSFYAGGLPVLPTREISDPYASEILKWSDSIREGKIEVLAKVSSPEDVTLALNTGADGIGYYSLKSVFLKDPNSIVQFINDPSHVVIGQEIEGRITASLFDLFEASSNHLVTVCLFGDSIGSLLPSLVEITKEMTIMNTRSKNEKGFSDNQKLMRIREQLNLAKLFSESNPLMGLRGARLSLIIPDLLRIQIRAIVNGIKSSKRKGITPKVRVLVPLVTEANEMKSIKEIIEPILFESGEKFDIGALLESPRAIIISNEIVKYSDFLVVATDELHQSMFGMDSNEADTSFLSKYLEMRVFESNPFEQFDFDGVGNLMSSYIPLVRKTNSSVPIGITGNHSNNDKTVSFSFSCGVNSVTSVSSVIPLMRLCAAKATLSSK